ncbi:hypothetical protein [Nocardia huaxiensis]|uniref:Uncharacterized protein n=1 Tax=Nocardia huaxiensis TaxID=2755382 RepID=A0A7D6VHH4_9NOCA|nr:hypothetical protein [Nocardia huaxiensis]QLY32937.1 hypothetical protein H0264_12465 [Nocardia huaxiensis]UFS93299.1 hypothetical protein LPY97_20875 [Nocardia huaxiensis]
MSPHQRFRTGVVAVSGALLLALGSGPLTVATAQATPSVISVAPAQSPNYPLAPDSGAPGAEPKKDKNAEKAESLGGGVATKVIDTVAGLLKCGLNFALPSVKCTV